MNQDEASVDASKERFIHRIVSGETVFHLTNDDGVANSVSNDAEETVILMFWSDEPYARRVQKNGFEDYEVACITLFDFLYSWLPGMADDEVLAGVNWDHELIGAECDSHDLRDEIVESMSADVLAEYESKFQLLTSEE
jgi:hypothetical protein